MKIRAIKPGHITYCPWCKAEGLKAVCQYHLTGANKQSCAYHRPQLEAIQNQANTSDDDLSEADYQTWHRL